MNHRLLLRLSSFTFCVAALSAPASAELTPLERATAEALFQRGTHLMDQGKYAEACDTFAATLEMESGLGTMLHLADCYDKLGKTASSWALFEDVAARAKVSGDTVRSTIASARAEDLQSRQSLVYLKFVDANTERERATPLRVELGGTNIPEAMWNAPIPLDPGEALLVVSADGYQTWTQKVVVAPGPTVRRVSIPRLTRLVQAPKPSLPPRARTNASARPRLVVEPKSVPANGTSATKVWGYVTGAVGLLGLGFGGYLGYRAYTRQQDSLELCRASNPNLCTPDGVEMREEAIDFARTANIAAVAGGAALMLGTTLIIVSPGATQTAATTPGARSASPTLTLSTVW